jgi:hypothetical protein
VTARPGPDFDGELLLTVAERLAAAAPTSGNEEAYYRSILNRTYYAPFITLIVRIRAECGAGDLPKLGVHRDVQKRLGREGLPELVRIRSILKGLEVDRGWADYEPHSSAPSEKRAADCLAKARRLTASIKGLPRAAIQRLHS